MVKSSGHIHSMATGNVFVLLINDGVQDTFLYAYQKLIDRIARIRAQNYEQCRVRMDEYYADTVNKSMSWLNDRAAYRANPRKFCEAATDSFDVVGEMKKTHNIFIDNTYKPCAALASTYLKATEKEGDARFGETTTFKINHNGIWVSDMVLHVRLTGLAARSAPDKVKYADWLGHRLMRNVEFKINELTLVNYGSEELNNHFLFHVPSNKRTGWLRGMGQEQTSTGYLSPDPVNNEFREYKRYGHGAQTPKSVHEDIDLFIPLIFWFNTRPELAFPNGTVPYGSVKIAVTFAAVSELVECIDYGAGGAYVSPTISVCELYINHITTTPDIAGPVLEANRTTLIRQTKRFETIVNAPDGQIHLKDLKYPVEHLVVGFRPVENYLDVNTWYRNVKLTSILIPTPVIVSNPSYALQLATDPGAQQLVSAINMAQYYEESDVISTLSLTVSGVDLFPVNNVNIYTNYTSFVSPGINTPDERGYAMFNFSMRNTNDPSGHLNASKNREIYLNYTSPVIDNSNRARLTVIAQTINFLIVNTGVVSMRFI